MAKILQSLTSTFKTPSKICLFVVAANSFTTTQVHAEETQNLKLNGFVSANSQIRSRGVSLTDESPSYMLNLNLINKNGFYGSVYGFAVDGVGSYGGEDLEVDYLLGYGKKIASLAVDAGMALYTYPGTSGYTFNEFYLSGSKKISDLDTKLGLMYVPERKSVGDNDKLYLYVDLKHPIGNLQTKATVHLGYTNGKGNVYAGPTGEFFDYSVGLEHPWKKFILSASYIGTTIDKTKADTYYALPNAKKGSDIVGGSLMGSIVYLF